MVAGGFNPRLESIVVVPPPATAFEFTLLLVVFFLLATALLFIVRVAFAALHLIADNRAAQGSSRASNRSSFPTAEDCSCPSADAGAD